MSKILEKLYDGEIYPAEQMKYVNPSHKTVWLEVQKLEEAFSETLSKTQKEDFEKVLHINCELNTLEMKQAFSEGFSLAVKVMIAVFEEGKYL